MDDYDVVIVGAGIAGLSAALASARAGRRTRVLTGPALGGQLISIEKIDGYPGFPEGIAGYDLCPMAQEQAAAAGAEFSAASATALVAHDGGWRVTSGEGDVGARAVVVATGASPRELGIPGEERLRGKGVSHCASCDGPLLRAKTVGVVGGGDSALQEALTLAQFVSRVIVLHRRDTFRAQAAYRDAARELDKIELRTNVVVEEVLGDADVSGVRVRNTADGSSANVEVAALFVYIGLAPNTAWMNGALELDSAGRIPTDDLMRTRRPGLFAVGTVRSGSAGRAVASGGDGATAAVAADRYLRDGAWRA
jgi:thioredoxin reductase (NADPH)